MDWHWIWKVRPTRLPKHELIALFEKCCISKCDEFYWLQYECTLFFCLTTLLFIGFVNKTTRMPCLRTMPSRRLQRGGARSRNGFLSRVSSPQYRLNDQSFLRFRTGSVMCSNSYIIFWTKYVIPNRGKI